MENITISPYDTNVKVMAQTVLIINEFKHSGFVTRGAFMNAVKDHWVGEIDFKTYEKLGRFWLCRLLDEEFIQKMNVVLQKLKAE